ncbi:MAG: hypothetical protein RRA94_15510, partial [Bacteroidota bacterium]|nr:hypothetical protein [Bacteroidota bacterium]
MRRPGIDMGVSAAAVCALLLCIAAAGEALAQTQAPEYQGRPRLPEGRLTFTAGGGVAKYNGEFTDQHVDAMYWGQASYTIGSYLRLGLSAEIGKLLYNRRHRRNTGTAYQLQFGEDAANEVLRSTQYGAVSALLFLDMLPAR